MATKRSEPEKRVRRRPRQRRGVVTVDAILTAAAHVLESRGLEGTNTNRIAEAAGVSIGSLYQYFPDKQAVMAALLARERRRARDALVGALGQARGRPLPEAVRGALAATLKVAREHAAVHELLFHEVARQVGDAAGGREARRAVEEDVRRFLEERRDEIAVDDPGRAAFTVVQAVNALAHEAMVAPRDELGESALLDEATALVLGYLGAGRGASG
jgi:AcrR family transcriptional regulator